VCVQVHDCVFLCLCFMTVLLFIRILSLSAAYA